jgi:hypothetical protein
LALWQGDPISQWRKSCRFVNGRFLFFELTSTRKGNRTMLANQEQTGITFNLDAAERVELLELLEREVRDTHVEARRTESPDFQHVVHDRENILARLLSKLRNP